MNKKISTALKMFSLSLALVFASLIFKQYNKKETGDAYIYVSSDGECSMTGYAMGTTVNIKLYGKTSKDTAIKVNDCIAMLDGQLLTKDIDRLVSDYKAGEPVSVDDRVFDIISSSLAICEDTNGALDITIEPLNELWGIDKKYETEFQIPQKADIKAAQELIGFEYVRAVTGADLGFDAKDAEKKYIIFDRNNIMLSVGAVGKGYALDIVRELIVKENTEGACIAIGGSVLAYGNKPDGEAFVIGIRDPRSDSDEAMIGMLVFEGDVNVCVSTSGDYEKYVERNGVRYHHIFDRNTGYPADSGLSSVTIVCESGIISDGLSTACFVLGYDASLPVLKKYNAEAVFIDKEGNVTVTDGLLDIYKEAY